MLTDSMDASSIFNFLIMQPSLSSRVSNLVQQPATRLLEWNSVPNASAAMSSTMVAHFQQIKVIAICHAEGIQPSIVVQEIDCPCTPSELHRSTSRRVLRKAGCPPTGHTKDVFRTILSQAMEIRQ
jgi:hypothetical protein